MKAIVVCVCAASWHGAVWMERLSDWLYDINWEADVWLTRRQLS